MESQPTESQFIKPQLTCKYCQGNIDLTEYFCPHCGKKLKDPPLSTTLGRQIYIYLFSLLLPPLGIWPAIRYLRQGDEKSKKIGITALILTVISVVVTSWITVGLINSINKQFSTQLNDYQGLMGN
jgi:hypothetical protein